MKAKILAVACILGMFAAYSPAHACAGGKPEPVKLNFDGVELKMPMDEDPKTVHWYPDYQVIDVYIVPIRKGKGEADGESRAQSVTIRRARDGVRKSFRIAWPPPARSGCDQPYVAE